MLEKRLGSFGHHLGTLVALAAAILIILSPVSLIVFIVSNLHGPINVNIAVEVLYWAAIAATWLFAVCIFKTLINRMVKMAKEASNGIAEAERIAKTIRDQKPSSGDGSDI